MKSRFVSMASHEFRTPLSAVQLSASLIEKYAQPYDNDNIRKHVAKIKGSVGILTGILNDFLSLEKLEAGKVQASFSPFNLVKFSEEMKCKHLQESNLNKLYPRISQTNTLI